MSELTFNMKEWADFDEPNGAILECIIRKKDGRSTRRANVMIWSVTNPNYPDREYIGKFFLVEPERNRTIPERLQYGPIFNSIDEAKPIAEQMLESYLRKIKNGEINWWTKEVSVKH